MKTLYLECAMGASGGAGVTNGFFDAIYENQVKR